MLRSLKDLEHYTVTAVNGGVGKVSTFLFDDEKWVVRYLVVKTSGLLAGRSVLVSPISFREASWATRTFHLALTTDKIRNSPSIDTNAPVSRQHERDFDRYYGYGCYWGTAGYWGIGMYPGSLAIDGWFELPSEEPAGAPHDVHLRSAHEVCGYHVHGSDEPIGHISDFILDDETWAVRYLAIDTSNWWMGKKVLIAPHWATNISWEKREVHVDLSRQAIKDSPSWDPAAAVDRDYESRLCNYYGRPVLRAEGDPLKRQSALSSLGRTM